MLIKPLMPNLLKTRYGSIKNPVPRLQTYSDITKFAGTSGLSEAIRMTNQMRQFLREKGYTDSKQVLETRELAFKDGSKKPVNFIMQVAWLKGGDNGFGQCSVKPNVIINVCDAEFRNIPGEPGTLIYGLYQKLDEKKPYLYINPTDAGPKEDDLKEACEEVVTAHKAKIDEEFAGGRGQTMDRFPAMDSTTGMPWGWRPGHGYDD